METISTLLDLCVGNSPIAGCFPPQRPVTRSLDVFVDLRLNKRVRKHSTRRWFEIPLRSLWCHCNDMLLLRMMNTSVWASTILHISRLYQHWSIAIFWIMVITVIGIAIILAALSLLWLSFDENIDVFYNNKDDIQWVIHHVCLSK